jgi:hypothetical protein
VAVSFSGVKVVESGSSNPLAFILVVFVLGYLAIGCRGGSCPTVPANGFASRSTAKRTSHCIVQLQINSNNEIDDSNETK